MKEVHGENIPWVKAPFDPQVMYNRTGRKPHGKFAIADDAIDSSEVQFSTNVRPQTQSSNHREKELEQEVRDLKRQRQQDCQSFYNAFAKFNEDMAQVTVLSPSLICYFLSLYGPICHSPPNYYHFC